MLKMCATTAQPTSLHLPRTYHVVPPTPLEFANLPALSMLLVLLVTFGRSSSSSLLAHAHTHAHSAGQTSAVAHVL